MFLSRTFMQTQEVMQEVELTPELLARLNLSELPDLNVETLSSIEREDWEAIWEAIWNAINGDVENVISASISAPEVDMESIIYMFM